MANPRRAGREVALQVLCGLDANPDLDPRAALSFYVSDVAGTEDETELPGRDAFDQKFARALVDAAATNREKIDETLTNVSKSWRLDRMARVDRNILRLAVAELLYFSDIPARVTINEAIELGKRFGAAETPAFVNGLLDSVLKALDLRK